MKLLAISGSARLSSTNTALLRALAEVSPVEIEVLHTLHHLPVFSPDLEGAKTPDVVAGFVKSIERADGLIISSPEYVHAIPGGLKNAIDWLVSGEVIINKPVALIHASHRGDDMLASLRLVLGTVTAEFQEYLFLRFPLVSKTPEEVAEYMRNPENRAQLQGFIADFSAVISEPLSL